MFHGSTYNTMRSSPGTPHPKSVRARSASVASPRPRADGMIEYPADRSEEHTSELQSRGHLVCRLLLEKKKNNNTDLNKTLTNIIMTQIFQTYRIERYLS